MRLPAGTVTFLFTDVEGSTLLLGELGAEGYADALAEHRRVIRAAFAAHGGVEVDTQGDAFFVAFPTAPGALAAAAQAQAALAIPVRMGVHTGTPLLAEEGYVGVDVNRAARIAAAGHGGQVLVSATARALVDGFELRDLGEHRLKDLAAAERVYQLGDEEYPPLASLYRTNLPIPATPFLGRERELAEVVELLTREDVRLLTLTGPGGTGKTRLALQAAAERAHAYPDGIWWVPLAALRDPALVLQTVANTLGVREEPNRQIADALAEHLGGKRLLLLLDNAEHLLPDIAATTARLRNVDRTTVLVTSRERLRLDGENLYPVASLDELEAVALFRARARALDPTFQPTPAVAELCGQLDGLPLAIELAAARTILFTPEQLLDRLAQRLDLLKGGGDADPRQQTLRATIAWSHDLLSPEERILFRQLAIFAAGCTYDAAESVCEADVDTLQSLLDKSLLRTREGAGGERRYWMLETIREFARDELIGSGDIDQLSNRHADHFLAFAQRVGATDLYERNQAERYALLAEETANLRTAIEWVLDHDRADQACRFGWSLWRYWSARGQTREGRAWLEAAVSRARPEAEERVWAVIGLSEIARAQGAVDRAKDLKEEAVRTFAERGDLHSQAGLLADLGDLAMGRGAFGEARELLEASLANRSPEFPQGIGRTLGSLGMLAVLENELDRAEELYGEAFERFSESDPECGNAGSVLAGWAEVARRRGNAGQQRTRVEQALRIFYALHDTGAVADCLESFAALAAADGYGDRAGRLVGAARGLRARTESIGSWPELVPRDTPLEAQRSGERMDLDEAVAYALSTVD